MTDQFDDPRDINYRKLTDFEGALLLVWPTTYHDGIKTAIGVSPMVEANIAVVDGPEAGSYHESVAVFQKVLRERLRGNVGTGRPVLGRLGKGEAQPGKSAPWILATATDNDRAAARRFLDGQASKANNAAPTRYEGPRTNTQFTDEPPF